MKKKIDVKKKGGWAIRGTIGSCPQVPVDEGYSRNTSCTLNLISTFLLTPNEQYMR
jgi:hypothetical protein